MSSWLLQLLEVNQHNPVYAAYLGTVQMMRLAHLSITST